MTSIKSFSPLLGSEGPRREFKSIFPSLPVTVPVLASLVSDQPSASVIVSDSQVVAGFPERRSCE
jgi:hypothetical protein